MKDSRGPARKRAAFLRVLKTHGNVQEAARTARVDKSWLYGQRRKSPVFAQGWAKAVALGREAVASGRVPLDGDMAIWAHKSGRSKLVRIKDAATRWTADAEATFLEHLATTANVDLSAAEAGFSDTAIYRQRMADAGFAARWDDALRQGYARIELLIVECACESLRPGKSPPGKAAMPRMTPAEVMNLLKLHRAAVHGGKPQRYGWRAGLPDPEAVKAEILRKIEAYAQRDAGAADG